MSERYIRVRTWREFKQLATDLKPEAVVYSIDQNAMSKTKDPTCLRLILSVSSGYYVYLDFPKGDALRETGIPIRKDKRGNLCLQDEDVKQFIKNSLGRADLQVYSFWTT